MMKKMDTMLKLGVYPSKPIFNNYYGCSNVEMKLGLGGRGTPIAP
jgi:hypothetical protein